MEIEIEIVEAAENREQFLKYFKKFSNNPENVNLQEMWKVLKKIRSRPARPDLGDLKQRREEIFSMHLKLAEENSSMPWNMSDLEKALKDLKNNKARDHAGYINEIFKAGVIGSEEAYSMFD